MMANNVINFQAEADYWMRQCQHLTVRLSATQTALAEELRQGLLDATGDEIDTPSGELDAIQSWLIRLRDGLTPADIAIRMEAMGTVHDHAEELAEE